MTSPTPSLGTDYKSKAHDMQYMEYWPSTLKHKSDILLEQLDVGLYSIKRYAFYLQKIVDIRRPALQEAKRVTEYELKEKTSKASKDGMGDFVTNYTMTQNILGCCIDYEINFISSIDRDVVQYILNWHRQAEKRLETTTKKLQSTFAKQRELLTKVTKSRQECHKHWSTLQSSYKESEKADQTKLTKRSGAKDYENAFKKYTKEVQKTYQLFNAFECEVREANEQQSRYWNDELPQCVKELEQLETDRLQTWGIAMEVFRNAQLDYFSRSFDNIKILDETTLPLDGSHELKLWTDSIVRAHGAPREPDEILDYLPCEYTRVQQGDDLQHLLSIDLSVALAQRQQTMEKNAPKASFMSTVNSAPSYTKPTYAHAVAKALYEYPQVDSDDLAMQPGDLIAVLDMPMTSGDESTWWIGAKFDPNTGRLLSKGVFPSNYITMDF